MALVFRLLDGSSLDAIVILSSLNLRALRTSLGALKIVIEISPEQYDGFVAKCDIASREYSILKNGLVVRDPKSAEQRMIGILCDSVEAARLLYAASLLYPEAVPAITAGIDRAREP